MVISSYELEKAKRIIYEEDPEAFIMVLPVKRIIGMFEEKGNATADTGSKSCQTGQYKCAQ
mgnify:CR=1 FL=1